MRRQPSFVPSPIPLSRVDRVFPSQSSRPATQREAPASLILDSSTPPRTLSFKPHLDSSLMQNLSTMSRSNAADTSRSATPKKLMRKKSASDSEPPSDHEDSNAPSPELKDRNELSEDADGHKEPDLLDTKVQEFLKHCTEIKQQHTVSRKSKGVYEVDGREVQIDIEPTQQDSLWVTDGPLKQPFADYLQMSESHAEYNTAFVAKTTALHHVPKEQRMTFGDLHRTYDRLDAMKVAKEQASVREEAADYTKDGLRVPDELVRKYNKALRQKLQLPGDDPVVVNADASLDLSRTRDLSRSRDLSRNSVSPCLSGSQRRIVEQVHVDPNLTMFSLRGISLNGPPIAATNSYIPTTVSGTASPLVSRQIPHASRSASGTTLTWAPPSVSTIHALPARGQVRGSSPMTSSRGSLRGGVTLQASARTPIPVPQFF